MQLRRLLKVIQDLLAELLDRVVDMGSARLVADQVLDVEAELAFISHHLHLNGQLHALDLLLR